MLKIWERYILKEAIQVFFLFLFCFYGLYIVIDYAGHASAFHHDRFSWGLLTTYYASEFLHRSDVLLPFALLVATVRTLTKLNQTNELTALRAAGIPLITLMRPLIYLGLFFTMFLYASEEWVLPKAMATLGQIQNKHASRKQKTENRLSAEHLILQDGTTLIFQNYDSMQGLFFDAYWVRSANEIYQIKSLDPHKEKPVGYHVNMLVRTPQNQLVVTASEKEREFPEMPFNKVSLLETIIPAEDLSLTKLLAKWPENNLIKSEKEAQIVTSFYRKLAAPWLCLFAVIAPIPLCVRFSRQIPVFLLYAINIFGLVMVYLILDSTQVLGKRQVADPALIIWGPFFLFSVVFVWRFTKLR